MTMKRRNLIGWGIGSFSSSVLINAIGLLHLRFMTDSLGLAMGLAGMLVVISRVYDAILDPIVGMISDRTQTRFGRYRPYLFVGGIGAAISMIPLFNVPSALEGSGLIVFVGVSLLFFSTVYTLFRIPYLALGRTITQDFTERSRLMTFSVYGSSLGALAATSAAPFLLAQFGSDRTSHAVIAWVLAAFIAVGAIATFLLIEADPAAAAAVDGKPAHLTLKQTVAALRVNRPFQCLIGFKVVSVTGFSVQMTAIPYYTRHVLGVSDASLSSIFLPQTLAMMASQIFWVRVAGTIGRRNALICAALLNGTVALCWYLVPAGNPFPWLQILGALSGIGGGGTFFGLYTLLSDTMDYSRRNGGDRVEGTLAGIFVMVEKATTAVGTFIFSAILGYVGYISAHDAGSATQPAGVVTGIILTVSLLPAAFALLGSLFLLALRLDKREDIIVIEEDEIKSAAAMASSSQISRSTQQLPAIHG